MYSHHHDLGCSTCRRRKVKCDEVRPVCQRCLSLSLSCEWRVPAKRRNTRSTRGTESTAPVRRLQPVGPLPQAASAFDVSAQPVFVATKLDHRLSLPAHDANANTMTTPWRPPTDWFGCPPLTHYSPLYHRVSDPNIPCANSLALSELDRKYLHYFPSSSIVFYYMKTWQWSSFFYMYQGPAATSKVIMRMILAISAVDMHRSGLAVWSPRRLTTEHHGRHHYGMALREFRELLEAPTKQMAPAELEMIFIAMFLMVTYEWQFGHCMRHLQLHLLGVKSLLETHPACLHSKDVDDILLSPDAEQSDVPAKQVSFIPEQLLLWIL